MAQSDKPGATRRRDKPGREPRLEKRVSTPADDMQPEDAGTAASGNAEPQAPGAGGSTAESAMKQTSKTAAESASSRRDT